MAADRGVNTGSSVTICRIWSMVVAAASSPSRTSYSSVLSRPAFGGVVEQQPVAVAVLVAHPDRRLRAGRRPAAGAGAEPLVGPANPASVAARSSGPRPARGPAEPPTWAAPGAGRSATGDRRRRHRSPLNCGPGDRANATNSPGPTAGGRRRRSGIPWPMDVDGGIGFDPSGVIESARLAERVGYDGIWSAEVTHDPVLPPGPGGRAHRADHARHRHRRGLRPQPDEPGHDGQRPPDPVRRAGSCSASGPRSSPTSRSGSPCRGPIPPPGCAS